PWPPACSSAACISSAFPVQRDPGNFHPPPPDPAQNCPPPEGSSRSRFWLRSRTWPLFPFPSVCGNYQIQPSAGGPGLSVLLSEYLFYPFYLSSCRKSLFSSRPAQNLLLPVRKPPVPLLPGLSLHRSLPVRKSLLPPAHRLRRRPGNLLPGLWSDPWLFLLSSLPLRFVH